METLTATRVLAGPRRGSSRPVLVDTASGRRLVKLRGAAQMLPMGACTTSDASLAEAVRRRRAAYVAFLWKRLQPPRAFTKM